MSNVSIDEIPKRCFENCSTLKTAIIPSVRYVREKAFNECNTLKTIDIKNAIDIENMAFYNCNIDRIIFTNNIKNIGNLAFAFNNIDYLEFGSNINSTINFGTNVFENSFTWVIDEINNNLQNMLSSSNNLTNYFFSVQQLSSPNYNIVTKIPFFINTLDHDISGSVSDPYHRLAYSSHKNIVSYYINTDRYTNNAVKFDIDPITLNINFIDESLNSNLELGLHIIAFSQDSTDTINDIDVWHKVDNYNDFLDVSNNLSYNYIFFAKRCRFITIKNIQNNIDPRWVKNQPSMQLYQIPRCNRLLELFLFNQCFSYRNKQN